ncbi:autophagy-related protein 13a [Carica papaya]|uniref:autophagy-related protein 13a n=1 Tax=Carica papaya TaxID=3649 RepID=UPI000B8CBA68|nr:autophagy-related protein 13a [Carica papaya]
MDLQANSQSESGKLEQIVLQFFLKTLHIILDSRIPSLHSHDRFVDLPSVPRVRKSDKWFNLVLGDRPAAFENLNFWHRNIMDPMVIDIILVSHGSSSVDNLYSPYTRGASLETVIERWVIQYESPQFKSPQTNESSTYYKKTYKKSIILLRSLYSQMRLLPAHRIFRQLSSSTQSYNFDLIYKVSSFSDPFSRSEEEMMKEYCFVPVEALPGRLCVSVTYRKRLSDFNLEPSTSLPPKIIADYVGSPSTDPMRSFPASEKGVRATSFPLRGVCPPSIAPSERPHSWTSGFHRPAPFTRHQSLGGSPPAYHISSISYDSQSPPADTNSHKYGNFRPPAQQKAGLHDEYQLSPPFSPSASPSTPTHFLGSHHMQTRLHSGTAPVTIPSQMTHKGSRYLSPNFSDPSKNSLPPLSPRSARNDSSSQESPSGIRSYRKAEIPKSGELYSGVINHYSGQKVVRDSKDDSGRFSGLLSSSSSPRVGFSRSSSKLSFQDDLDDCDFSCPFDVDDVETPDSGVSQTHGQTKTSDFTAQSLPTCRKSQDAAVGILVQMLRTAPPLRQDPSYYESDSMRTEVEGGGIGTASAFLIPRRTADALEELRSYREMKELLLSKSGTLMTSKEKA